MLRLWGSLRSWGLVGWEERFHRKRVAPRGLDAHFHDFAGCSSALPQVYRQFRRPSQLSSIYRGCPRKGF